LGGGAGDAVTLVLQVQLVVDAVELVQQFAAGARVEREPAFDHPVQRARRRTTPRLVQLPAGVLGGLGVGALTPVGDDPAGVTPPQAADVVDQVGFVVGETGVPPALVGPSQQIDVISGDVTVGERGRGVGHGAQFAAPAHLDPGRGRGESGVAAQAGLRRLRPVVGPGFAGIPHRDQLGRRRCQAVPLPLHRDHRRVQLGVGQRVDVERLQGVDRLLQRGRLHEPIVSN
jgi:hypothetical protein